MSAIDWNKPIEPVLGAYYLPGATAKLLHTLTGPGVGPYSRVVLVHYGDGSEGIFEYDELGIRDSLKDGPVLRNVRPPGHTRQYWVNLYDSQGLDCFHRDRLAADTAASPERIACVPVNVEFRPGDGL